jgi:hypothetical protein
MDVEHIRDQDIKVTFGPRSEKVSFSVFKKSTYIYAIDLTLI